MLIRKACEEDTTGKLLVLCAERAIEAGLYAETDTPSDVRHSLIRKFWRLNEAYRGFDSWWRYVTDFRYVAGYGRWKKKPIIRLMAA